MPPLDRIMPSRIWGQAVQDLQRLAELTQKGQSLAYGMSNLDDVFRQRFGSYDSFRSQVLNGSTFSTVYSAWSNTQRDTIGSTLKAANLTADQLATDADVLKQLQAASSSADGLRNPLICVEAFPGCGT
jgi:P-type conjugative transfer protein TrbJ